jgi:hypothetical protein
MMTVIEVLIYKSKDYGFNVGFIWVPVTEFHAWSGNEHKELKLNAQCANSLVVYVIRTRTLAFDLICHSDSNPRG